MGVPLSDKKWVNGFHDAMNFSMNYILANSCAHNSNHKLPQKPENKSINENIKAENLTSSADILIGDLPLHSGHFITPCKDDE